MNRSQTILIVEDEAITAISQARTLEHEGYRVTYVMSGEEAIDLFRKHEQRIDLILMDIDLGGGMDGTTAAQEILKVYDVPVLFLSSHTEKEIVEKTEKITSYGYVVKNSGITVLAASIKMAFKLHEAHRNIEEQKQEIEAANEELQATNEQLEAANIELMQFQRELMERERILAENEERYRQLVDNAGEAIVVAQDNRLKFANPMASTLTGFTGEELQSRPFIEFVHPNDRSLVASRHAARFTGGTSPPVYQFRLLNKDGGYRWIEINVVEFMWEKSPATLNFFKDITEQKLAEIRLRESEERFRTLIESAPMAIAISRDTTFIYANRMFMNMFGYRSLDELIGRPISDMVAEQDAAVFVNRSRKREEGADVESFYETTGLHRNGNRFPLTAAAARVNLPDGPASIGFFQDITRHRNAEEVLKKTVMEKEILLKELHHRVKNNLNVISSLLGLEMEKLNDEGSRQVFINALSRINSMAVIYEQLNRTSKLAGVNLGLYIMDLAELTFKTYAPDPQLIHLETRAVDMELDIKRAVPLGIILNELVSNAIKNAYPPGVKGTIRIDLENTGGRITLRVSDEGPGFPPGFDPETTDTLGLKLVATLAKQINADLAIRNHTGATIEVAFTL